MKQVIKISFKRGDSFEDLMRDIRKELWQEIKTFKGAIRDNNSISIIIG